MSGSIANPHKAAADRNGTHTLNIRGRSGLCHPGAGQGAHVTPVGVSLGTVLRSGDCCQDLVDEGLRGEVLVLANNSMAPAWMDSSTHFAMSARKVL